jgi:tryptophan 6-halogenase
VIDGDLFIDCTGFRGLLLNKTLGEPFVSFQETLPNDSAVALRVPADMERDGIRPCTTATAQDAGWIWTIPLYGRVGTGYVYAGDYTTPEEAEHTLREFVGPQAADLEANHIRMRIGRSRNSWVDNCVAIGLASGFVEPLESTGIFFIQQGVEELLKHFPDAGWDPGLRESYSYLAMLLGLGGVPLKPAGALSLMDGTRAAEEFQAIKDEAQELVKRLPGHYEYLTQMY